MCPHGAQSAYTKDALPIHAAARITELERAVTLREERELALLDELAKVEAALVEAQSLIVECRSAFAEELSAWDIDPPIHHVKQAFDHCGAWLDAARASAGDSGKDGTA